MHVIDGVTPFEWWTGCQPDVSHLEAFGLAIWILKEGISINKLNAKSEKHTFVGFVDGPCTICFYDMQMQSIKTSCNFYFLNRMVSQPVQMDDSLHDTQHEGESRPGDALDTVDNENTKSIEWETNVSKQKQMDEDETYSSRRSSRPRVVRDYWVLNDPAPELSEEENDNLPEITQDPDEDEPRESPVEQAELVYVALNESVTLPDNPRMLKEAHTSVEWLEWEKAIKAAIDQLYRMVTWQLVDLPKGRSPVANKWVLVQKYSKEGKLEKYKARLVVKGYSQIPSCW